MSRVEVVSTLVEVVLALVVIVLEVMMMVVVVSAALIVVVFVVVARLVEAPLCCVYLQLVLGRRPKRALFFVVLVLLVVAVVVVVAAVALAFSLVIAWHKTYPDSLLYAANLTSTHQSPQVSSAPELFVDSVVYSESILFLSAVVARVVVFVNSLLYRSLKPSNPIVCVVARFSYYYS